MEVLRAVSYLVRDRDWGAYAPDIADLIIEQQGEGFLSLHRRLQGSRRDRTRDRRAHLGGSRRAADLPRRMRSPGTGFETNRCGFCILHPIVSVAGARITVEHADGRRVGARFPDLIEP